MTTASKEQKHEKRLRRRSLKKLTGLKESFKDDARRAVQEAAQQASDSILSNNGSQASLDTLRRRPSLDFSHDSNLSSDCSHEKAIRRGSRLALSEYNEGFGHYPAPSFSDSSHSAHELTTVTDTRMTSISEERKKPVTKWMFRKRREVKKIFLTSGITQEAWMCGVCAKSFASLEAAEKHEDYHIKEVVMDLGWMADNHTTSILSAPETPRRPKTTAEASAVFHETPVSSLQPRPDVLRKSVQKMATARVSFRTNTPAMQREQGFDADRFPLDSPTLNEGAPARMPKVQPPILKAINKRPRRISAIEEDDLLVPYGMREYVVLADEALLDVCNKAEPLILTQSEIEAEVELEWLAKDKDYYQRLAERALERQRDGAYSRFRTEGKTIVNKVQNKFVDAYQLMKEGQTKGNTTLDHYNRKTKGDAEGQHLVDHSKNTLYVNVIVKNSIQVVSHELERLARQRWVENEQNNLKNEVKTTTGTERFRKFRAAAQGNLVKLAGLALASDFTPRRIAVQLSNDLYRLLTPRLKRRGVSIETEIEYRVGPYFVLAVNILTIDWGRVVKMTNRDVAERKSRWLKSKRESGEEEVSKEKEAGVVISFVQALYRLSRLTRNEVLAQLLAWLYYTHWIIYTPICWFLYHFAIGTCFRAYFLSSVADEIFFYVEEKGMEMEVDIREAYNQAAFMLSALRELRADGRELKKKQNESETDGKGSLLGPLLGPAIKEDKEPAPPMPDGFEAPENLEFIGLQLDLPVGFRRLRWAFLNSQATFITEAVFKAAAKYENLVIGTWSKFDESIGLTTSLPEGVNEKDFIGLEKEMNYLMPKSAFVKANTCYETSYIEAYDDYCFCIKKKALSPEVPYGTTFVAWTKFVIINTGGDTCKMTCSVEAEFPNGPPMISRQIKSGMRAGVGELFVKIGETITKYADEFP